MLNSFVVCQLTLTILASLAMSHVIEDVLHGAAMRQVALSDLAVGLLASLTFVSVKQENELLLDQFALLGIGGGRRSGRGGSRRDLGAGTHQTSLSTGNHAGCPSHRCNRGPAYTRLRLRRALQKKKQKKG